MYIINRIKFPYRKLEIFALRKGLIKSNLKVLKSIYISLMKGQYVIVEKDVADGKLFITKIILDWLNPFEEFRDYSYLENEYIDKIAIGKNIFLDFLKKVDMGNIDTIDIIGKLIDLI